MEDKIGSLPEDWTNHVVTEEVPAPSSSSSEAAPEPPVKRRASFLQLQEQLSKASAELDRIRQQIVAAESHSGSVDAQDQELESLGLHVGSHRGEWSEIFDEKTRLTCYYNSTTNVIQPQKPRGWVRMMAQHRFSS